ncbi:hypothetical protein BLNAU_10884 [Blattamonas nauphoetae]|uniref:Protein kinase domain-containing protein n=1 Tax=Blattamonas nauphoetae TaxID=2049346 RepID=A0ABQ9XR01_9EUKA|nr:hypothetical protein BLNAU_10884 [Blattamonas nauphoetae]
MKCSKSDVDNIALSREVWTESLESHIQRFESGNLGVYWTRFVEWFVEAVIGAELFRNEHPSAPPLTSENIRIDSSSTIVIAFPSSPDRPSISGSLSSDIATLCRFFLHIHQTLEHNNRLILPLDPKQLDLVISRLMVVLVEQFVESGDLNLQNLSPTDLSQYFKGLFHDFYETDNPSSFLFLIHNLTTFFTRFVHHPDNRSNFIPAEHSFLRGNDVEYSEELRDAVKRIKETHSYKAVQNTYYDWAEWVTMMEMVKQRVFSLNDLSFLQSRCFRATLLSLQTKHQLRANPLNIEETNETESSSDEISTSTRLPSVIDVTWNLMDVAPSQLSTSISTQTALPSQQSSSELQLLTSDQLVIHADSIVRHSRQILSAIHLLLTRPPPTSFPWNIRPSFPSKSFFDSVERPLSPDFDLDETFGTSLFDETDDQTVVESLRRCRAVVRATQSTECIGDVHTFRTLLIAGLHSSNFYIVFECCVLFFALADLLPTVDDPRDSQFQSLRTAFSDGTVGQKLVLLHLWVRWLDNKDRDRLGRKMAVSDFDFDGILTTDLSDPDLFNKACFFIDKILDSDVVSMSVQWRLDFLLSFEKRHQMMSQLITTDLDFSPHKLSSQVNPFFYLSHTSIAPKHRHSFFPMDLMFERLDQHQLLQLARLFFVEINLSEQHTKKQDHLNLFARFPPPRLLDTLLTSPHVARESHYIWIGFLFFFRDVGHYTVPFGACSSLAKVFKMLAPFDSTPEQIELDVVSGVGEIVVFLHWLSIPSHFDSPLLCHLPSLAGAQRGILQTLSSHFGIPSLVTPLTTRSFDDQLDHLDAKDETIHPYISFLSLCLRYLASDDYHSSSILPNVAETIAVYLQFPFPALVSAAFEFFHRFVSVSSDAVRIELVTHGLLDHIMFAVSCSPYLDDYEKGVAVIGIILDTFRRDYQRWRMLAAIWALERWSGVSSRLMLETTRCTQQVLLTAFRAVQIDSNKTDSPNCRNIVIASDIFISTTVYVNSEAVNLIGSGPSVLIAHFDGQNSDRNPPSTKGYSSQHSTLSSTTPPLKIDPALKFLFTIVNSSFSVRGIDAICNSDSNGVCDIVDSSVRFSSCSITSSGLLSPFRVGISTDSQPNQRTAIILSRIVHITKSSSQQPLVDLFHPPTESSSRIMSESPSFLTSPSGGIAVHGIDLQIESKAFPSGTGPLFSFTLAETTPSQRHHDHPIEMETSLLSTSLTNVTSPGLIVMPGTQLFGSEVSQRMVGCSVSHSTNHDSGTGMMSPNMGGNVVCLNTSFSSCIRLSNDEFSMSFNELGQDDRKSFGELNTFTSVSFTLCSFSNINHVGVTIDGEGGAICLKESAASLTVTSCSFLECHSLGESDGGGGVKYRRSYGTRTPVTLTGSSFLHCSAYAFGGSVCVTNSLLVKVTDCFVEQSEADRSGEAVSDSFLIGRPDSYQFDTQYSTTSVERLNELDPIVLGGDGLTATTGSRLDEVLIYSDSGSTADSSLFCGERTQPCVSVELGWSIVEMIGATRSTLGIVDATTLSARISISHSQHVVITKGTNSEPTLRIPSSVVHPSADSVVMVAVEDAFFEISSVNVELEPIDLSFSLLSASDSTIVLLSVSLTGSKLTSEGNDDPTTQELCEWESGIIKLVNSSTSITLSGFSRLSQGVINMKGSSLTIQTSSFSDNTPRSTLFPSFRRNIRCSDEGEIEIGSLSGGDGASDKHPHLWISADDCQLDGEEAKPEASHFIPTLSSDSSSSFVKKEKTFNVTIQGTVLIPCSLSLEVFEKTKDGLNGKSIPFALTAITALSFDETCINLAIPLSSLSTLDDTLEWRGRLAYGKEPMTNTSFLIQLNATARLAQSVRENMKWWLPLVIVLVFLALLAIAIALICLCRKKQSKEKKAEEMRATVESPIEDEKVDVHSDGQIGVNSIQTFTSLGTNEETKQDADLNQSDGLADLADVEEAVLCAMGELKTTVYVSKDRTLYNALHSEIRWGVQVRQTQKQLVKGLQQISQKDRDARILRVLTAHNILFDTAGNTCFRLNLDPTPHTPLPVFSQPDSQAQQEPLVLTNDSSQNPPNQSKNDPSTEGQRWFAPEVIEKKQNINSIHAAVFSLGLVLWEMETGSVPFGEQDAVNASRQIVAGTTPKLELVKNKDMRELIEKCLTHEASQRPHLDDIDAALSLIGADNAEDRKEMVER